MMYKQIGLWLDGECAVRKMDVKHTEIGFCARCIFGVSYARALINVEMKPEEFIIIEPVGP